MKRSIIYFGIALLFAIPVIFCGVDSVDNFGFSMGIKNIFWIKEFNLSNMILATNGFFMFNLMFSTAWSFAKAVFALVKEVPMVGVVLGLFLGAIVFFITVILPILVVGLAVAFVASIGS